MTTEKCKSLQYYSPNFSRFPLEIFIPLSWCSRWPIHHQVIVHSLTLPLSALTAIISLESFTPETHKRQEVSCNWKLGLCIQVTYLRQGYLILLTQIVTDSAVQTRPHRHRHTHTHIPAPADEQSLWTNIARYHWSFRSFPETLPK